MRFVQYSICVSVQTVARLMRYASLGIFFISGPKNIFQADDFWVKKLIGQSSIFTKNFHFIFKKNNLI